MDLIKTLVDLSTIISALPVLNGIYKYFKGRKYPISPSVAQHQNNISVVAKTINIFNINPYPIYNLEGAPHLSELEVKNYNFKNRKIQFRGFLIMIGLFLIHFIIKWKEVKPTFAFKFSDFYPPISPKISLLGQQLHLIFLTGFEKLFQSISFTQIFFSSIVIIKMSLNPNVFYRIKNIIIFSLSILSTLYFSFVMNKLQFFKLNNLLPSSPFIIWDLLRFSLGFVPILSTVCQTLYSGLLIINCFKILRIGELHSEDIAIQEKRNRFKNIMIIFPLIFMLWYFFLSN